MRRWTKHGEEILHLFAVNRRAQISSAFQSLPDIEEIRVRVGWPVLIRSGGMDYWFHPDKHNLEPYQERGRWTRTGDVMEKEVLEMLSYITRYSLYAYEEELRQGFVTVQGGHRIGVAGQVLQQDGKIKNLSHISFLNIRVARQVWHCADDLLPFLWKEDGTLHHTLLVSPPGIGKTTLLRECIRRLSYGTSEHAGKKIGVVDERSELAACYLGVPQNDLGPRTDVLDGCSKSEGIRMLLRAMSPQILAVDELGSEADYAAVQEAFTCGCSLLGTMHGGSYEELCRRSWIREWQNQGLLGRLVLLRRDNDGKRTYQIYDAKGEQCGQGILGS